MSGSTCQPLQYLENITSAPRPARSTLSFNGIPPKIYHRCEDKYPAIRRASLHLLTGASTTPGSTAVPLSLHGWMDSSSWFSRNCFDIRVLQLRNSSLKEFRHPQPLKSSTKMDCRSILHRSSEQMGDPTTPNCEHLRERSQIRIAN